MKIETDNTTEQAIAAAALDYYEGWFNKEPNRMDRALHPELVKRSRIRADHQVLEVNVPVTRHARPKVGEDRSRSCAPNHATSSVPKALRSNPLCVKC
jgi:hypothetical protein